MTNNVMMKKEASFGPNMQGVTSEFTFIRSYTASSRDEATRTRVSSSNRSILVNEISKSRAPSKKEDMNSMQSSMSTVIFIAQLFSLFPVRGFSCHRAEDLSFTWRCFRTVYAIAIGLAMVIGVGLVLAWLIEVDLNFRTAGALVFYVNGSLSCYLFLKMAKKWPELALFWQSIEQSQIKYGYPNRLRFKVRLITFLFLFVGTVEHGLSHTNSFYLASQCTKGGLDHLRRYFAIHNRHVFKIIPYSPTMAVYSTTLQIIGAFCWSFPDVFLIAISMTLASRFTLLNNHLKQTRGKAMSESFWKGVRTDYEALSYLTKKLDDCVSGLILLSFGTDLFFICQQLLYSMNHMYSDVQRGYIYLSFSYLTVRTVAKAMCLSYVYEESQVPKQSLYSAPSESYNVEIYRFLTQVTTDSIALTGQNFFPVTRTVLLTLAGTIVTYEIVLIQFGTTSEETGTNLTELCLNVTQTIDR